jgi:hypothetical protein
VHISAKIILLTLLSDLMQTFRKQDKMNSKRNNMFIDIAQVHSLTETGREQRHRIDNEARSR